MYAHHLWPILRNSFSPNDYQAAGVDETRTPSGLGFFPSCDGVWEGPKNPRHKRLLFVGQDFGSEAKLRLSGETRATPTWSHLDALLKATMVDADLCFFTNAVMGARKSKSTGPSPAFKLSPPFINKCADFLVQQVAVVMPDAIVILGLEGLPVWQKITKPFPTATSFSPWDNQTNRRAIKVTIGAWTGDLILLVHPCYRPANLPLRSAAVPPTAASGDAFEVKLLMSIM